MYIENAQAHRDGTLIPLAVSVVFGLLTSTLLVLFVIPALYAILADLGFIHGSQWESAQVE